VDPIVIYGADWCGDCRRAKRLLDARGAAYIWVDVEGDPGMAEEARRIGRSKRIPVVAFPDGSVLVEPTDPELAEELDRVSPTAFGPEGRS
jgi:glutaredoxin